MSGISDEVVASTLRRLAAARRDGATFCPSEAARALAADWRPLMPQIREVVGRMVEAGELRCTQRGLEVLPLSARGAIRLQRRDQRSS